MKLAIDCRMLGSGGIGTYLQSLLPFFTKDHECFLLIKTQDIERYSELKNIEVIPCDIPSFSLKELLLFPKEILTRINACHVYYSPYCNIPRGIKIPVYTTIHDVVFLDVKGLSGTIGTIARKWFYQHAINRSESVFTVSAFSKQRIQHHLHTGKTPVTVTYNSVPAWFLKEDGQQPSKTETILFVGNIKKHKGLHTLIGAFRKCLSEGFGGKLVIVGNANNFRTSDTSVSMELEELKDYVLFTGRISDAELRDYYKQAKLLIQPSLYEGFGMPPLEALSSGTNVILSDIPVFKEIYGKLPVTFFKTEDADDLSDKIIEKYNSPAPVITECPYSFSRTYDIINKELSKGTM